MTQNGLSSVPTVSSLEDRDMAPFITMKMDVKRIENPMSDKDTKDKNKVKQIYKKNQGNIIKKTKAKNMV